MKKLILLSLLVLSSTLSAQLPRSLLKSTDRISLFDDYDGSIYMHSRYKESSVIHEKSSTFDAKLKYNIYTDALEYTQNSKLFEVLKSPTIHARIDDDYFYYCDFKSQRGLDRKGYYILVELNDKYRIYKKLTLKIKDPEKGTITKTTDPGQIRVKTTYYLEEDGIVLELPKNKKDMLATFSDKEEELQKYIKQSKIRLRKEEDLIRFVARYNAMKSESHPTQSLISTVSDRN